MTDNPADGIIEPEEELSVEVTIHVSEPTYDHLNGFSEDDPVMIEFRLDEDIAAWVAFPNDGEADRERIMSLLAGLPQIAMAAIDQLEGLQS